MGMNVSEMTSENISEMTENFLKSGGHITKGHEVKDALVEDVFEFWMTPSIKTPKNHWSKNLGSNWVTWNEEMEMNDNHHKGHRLCPFNVLVKKEKDFEIAHYFNLLSERVEKVWKEMEIESNYRLS